MKIAKTLLAVLLLTGMCFAACPASQTCPEDGAEMYPTGQVRFVNGMEEHQYAHTAWGPNQDPTKAAPVHRMWVVCKQ